MHGHSLGHGGPTRKTKGLLGDYQDVLAHEQMLNGRGMKDILSLLHSLVNTEMMNCPLTIEMIEKLTRFQWEIVSDNLERRLHINS